MSALLAAVTFAAETAGDHKQLEMSDLLVYLGIIVAAVFFVVLAGLGYFSPSGGDDSHGH